MMHPSGALLVRHSIEASGRTSAKESISIVAQVFQVQCILDLPSRVEDVKGVQNRYADVNAYMHTNTPSCALLHFDVHDSTELHNETEVSQQQAIVDGTTVEISACRVASSSPLHNSL
jgi:hypothetical protein